MGRDLPEAAAEIIFEALIVPHRSLSVTGQRWLGLSFVGLCGLIALRFGLLGAWPVIGFCVVEIVILLGLLYLNGRGARASELLLLSANRLRVIRTTPGGKRSEVAMQAAWLNVTMEEGGGRVPRLLLGQRDLHLEIAAALGEAEKRALAAALRDVLHKARNPRFDHIHLD